MGRIKPAALLRQSKRQKGPSRPSVTTIAACNFVIVMLLLSIVFISKQRRKQGEVLVMMQSTGEVELSSQYAVLNTSKGLVTLQLYGQQAPKAVENFVTHSQNGDYNGDKFFRVIDGFMIQERDQGSNETDGSSLSDVKFNDELGDGHEYEPFTVTLENLGPDTDASRFFITTVGTPHLNHKKHTVIGCVVHGQNVLQDMANYLADLSDQPVNQVVMYNIHLRDSV